jgi:hypothetical protein
MSVGDNIVRASLTQSAIFSHAVLFGRHPPHSTSDDVIPPLSKNIALPKGMAGPYYKGFFGPRYDSGGQSVMDWLSAQFQTKQAV